MQNLIQVDRAVLAELDSWLNDHNGPKLSSEAATALIRGAFSEYLESAPDDFVDRHDVHRFNVTRHDGERSSPADFDLGAVRVPSTSGSRRWLVGSLSTTRPTNAYEVERRAVVQERQRTTTAVDVAESAAVVHRDAVAIPRSSSISPMLDLTPTQPQKQPDDSLTRPVRIDLPSAKWQQEERPFTIGRCAIAGIWASVVGATGYSMIDGLFGVLVAVVLLGMPWLIFTIHDRNVSGKPLEAFEGCGVLLGGAFLSGFCALPFALIYAVVMRIAR